MPYHKDTGFILLNKSYRIEYSKIFMLYKGKITKSIILTISVNIFVLPVSESLKK